MSKYPLSPPSKSHSVPSQNTVVPPFSTTSPDRTDSSATNSSIPLVTRNGTLLHAPRSTGPYFGSNLPSCPLPCPAKRGKEDAPSERKDTDVAKIPDSIELEWVLWTGLLTTVGIKRVGARVDFGISVKIWKEIHIKE